MPLQESINNINSLGKSLNSMFYERQEEIKILLLALCSKENVFFLGKAGVSKSLLIEAVSHSLDSTYFSSLLCKDSKADQLFGPFKISDLKKDQRNRNTNNMLPEAEIVFLDEIFKANSTILNNLLKCTNEKQFYNNGKWNDIPLKSLFGASNELPQDKSLKALYDRFLFRKEVKSIGRKKNFIDLMKEQPNIEDLPKISFEDFDQVYQASKQIEDCSRVIEAFYNIKNDLKITSDRRCVKAYRAMKVSAVLGGRSKVTPKDLMILQHILWDEPNEHTEVCAKIAEHVGSRIRDAVALSQKLLLELGLDPNVITNYDEAVKQIKMLGVPENTSLLSKARRSCANIEKELEEMANEDEDIIEIYEQYRDLWAVFQDSLKKSIGL